MGTILVTGANGFIGHALVESLRSDMIAVRALGSQDGDIAELETLLALNEEIAHVVHLAGKTFIPDAWQNPAEFQRVNLGGTMNVLEFCRKHKIGLTYVSAYLYGIPQFLPIPETAELNPNNPYALSKCMAESACRFYADYYDLAVTIIRPFNIFGLGQKAHFLIPEIISQVLAKQSIRLKDLAPKRDYLYITDLIDALKLTFPKKKGLSIYNIGFGKSLSVAEIIDEIQEVAGTTLPVISENLQRENEIMDVYADISSAQKQLGWSPRIKFKDGIKLMINGVSTHE